MLIVLVLWSLIPINLCVKRARSLNRNKIAWGFLGAIFGWIAVLFIYAAYPEPKKVSETNIKLCPFCGEDILTTAKKCKHCGEWFDSK